MTLTMNVINADFMKRICAFFLKILFAIPALLVVLILRMFQPFIVIRLGNLDISRIGGMYAGDWYLSEYSSRMLSKGRWNCDIFYFTTMDHIICNQQWLKMWKRVLRTVPFGQFFKMVNRISMMFPGHQAHILPMNRVSTITTKEKEKLRCILGYKKPHIAFTKEEETFGSQALRELGVPENKPFVCFHARDAAYLNVMYPKMTWSYHDYRDSSINNYIPSVEELTRRGYCAIRAGAVVKEKLAVNNPDIIDYACNGKRTDFLDIYLGAKCEFFICSDTGVSIFPEAFRRPVVYTNWSPIRRISPWVLNGLFIFKKFYSHKKKRLLTFLEIINSDFGSPATKDFFAQQQIELIENTPEEITDVVMEMEDRLKGKWETTREDEELQERFWALFGPDRLKSQDVRIGSNFLREHEQIFN